MIARRHMLGLLAGLCLAGLAGPGLAQALDPLRPTLGDEPSADDPATMDTPPEVVDAAPDVVPEEPPPRRRRRAVIEDPYAPQGIGLGGLRLFPVLEADAIAGSDPRVGLRLRPSARLRSDWSRHAFEAGASADLTYGIDEGEVSDLTGNADSRLRLDFARGLTGTLDTRYGLDLTPASDAEVPNTASESRIDQTFGATGALEQDLGRLRLRGEAGLALSIFDDVKLNGGGVEDNGDRDFLEPELTGRITYDGRARLKPYGELSYRPRFHLQARDRNGLDRDSQGLIVAAGLSFDDAPFWTGDLALTYVLRDYADSALGTADALGLAGSLTWQPTDLTRIVFAGTTGISESASSAAGGTPEYSFSAILTHTPREYLSLSAGLVSEYDDVAGPGGDLTLTPRFGFIYRLSPELALTGAAEAEFLDGAAAGTERTDYSLSVGVEFRR